MKHNTDALRTQRMIHTAAISLAVFIMLFAITCGFFRIGSHEESLSMDDSMHIVIYRNAGSTDTYRRPYFSPVRKGETMEVTIPVVKDKGFRHAALTFVLYHCEVQAYCGNERIYTQERLKKGQQIGGRLYMISLPYSYQTKTIHIIAENKENDIFSSFENVRIVPDVKSLYSLETGQTFSLILFLTLLTVSGYMAFYFVIHSIMERHVDAGIHLSLFMILITTWYLGYSNLFHVISDIENLCANIEYPALIFAPAAMAAYMNSVIVSPKW